MTSQSSLGTLKEVPSGYLPVDLFYYDGSILFFLIDEETNHILLGQAVSDLMDTSLFHAWIIPVAKNTAVRLMNGDASLKSVYSSSRINNVPVYKGKMLITKDTETATWTMRKLKPKIIKKAYRILTPKRHIYYRYRNGEDIGFAALRGG
jgi:hypothetical protein